MSVLHAIAQATIAPTPSASPAVQAVQAVVQTTNSNAVTDFVNKLAGTVSQADIIAAAGVISSALIALLNRSKFLQHELAVIQDARRFTVAIILPFIGTYLVTLASGHNDLGVAPAIFLVSQVVFYIVKFLKNANVPAVAQLATEEVAVG